MKYPIFTLTSDERYVCCKLLREVNKKLALMHRFAVKGLDDAFESEHTEAVHYLSGYIDALIVTRSTFHFWIYKRIGDKILRCYKDDAKILREIRSESYDWVYSQK